MAAAIGRPIRNAARVVPGRRRLSVVDGLAFMGRSSGPGKRGVRFFLDRPCGATGTILAIVPESAETAMAQQTVLSEEDWMERGDPETAWNTLRAGLNERRQRLLACAC